MLNSLKWDLISYIKKNYSIYLGYAAVYILALLPLSPPASIVFDVISAVYCAFLFFFTLIVSIAVPTSWLTKNSAQLELSVPVKPWEKLLGKFACSACIIAFTMLLMKLMELQAGKFGMDMYPTALSFVQNLICMLTLAAIITFSYITAKSFAPTRRIAGLITVLLTIGILVLLGYISYPFLNIHIQQTPINSDGGYISYPAANPDSNWMQIVFSTALPAILIVLLFWGSSELLKKRFERY